MEQRVTHVPQFGRQNVDANSLYDLTNINTAYKTKEFNRLYCVSCAQNFQYFYIR